MITFGSDVADLILQRTLGENTLGLNNSINRMTTGYKVNQAKDNAAGYSIITDLSKKISSMLQVQQNTEDGIALLQTAEGGLEEVQKLLERLRDLATQASNGTYDAETREAMQAEADQILEQISQIRESIQYDNQNLYYRENNGNTTKTKSDDTISKNPAGRAAALSAVSFSANALSSALEGAEAFAGGETKTITIDGVQYTVKNKLTTANDLSYSKDASTGELTLIASNFEIRGQEDAEHNLIISGRNNPSLDVMTKILHRYPQINPDWLLLGKGEMLRDNTPAMVPADNIAKNPPQIQVVPEGHQELPFQESRKELENSEKTWAVSVEKPSKTVSKIMVFYSDNTYDTFVPEKQESE